MRAAAGYGARGQQQGAANTSSRRGLRRQATVWSQQLQGAAQAGSSREVRMLAVVCCTRWKGCERSSKRSGECSHALWPVCPCVNAIKGCV